MNVLGLFRGEKGKMRFFVPYAETTEQTENVYQSIRTFLSKELGADFSSRKVHKIRYTQNGENHFAKIGEESRVNGEDIFAILYEEISDIYHVCTPNRGVARGCSIMVGGDEVRESHDFDIE